MLFVQILIFLALAAAAGFLFARFVLAVPGAGAAPAAGLEARCADLERERDRLRVGLEEARRHPQELAEAEARLDHLKAELERARSRIAELEGDGSRPDEAGQQMSPAAEATPGTPPERLDGPDGEKDNLKRINGIGTGTERTLNELGIYHLRQIAAFTPENVAWVDRHLAFRGRIAREDWVGQARTLLGADGAADGAPPARPYGADGDPAQV